MPLGHKLSLLPIASYNIDLLILYEISMVLTTDGGLRVTFMLSMVAGCLLFVALSPSCCRCLRNFAERQKTDVRAMTSLFNA